MHEGPAGVETKRSLWPWLKRVWSWLKRGQNLAIIVAALLGSGATWRYLDWRIAQDRQALEELRTKMDLRERITDGYLELIQSTNRYADVRDSLLLDGEPGWEVSLPPETKTRLNNEKVELKERAGLLTDDIANLEAMLAKMEDREPRHLVYGPRPAPPTRLRVQ